MIEIKILIADIPGKAAVSMELNWDNRRPHSAAERAFADEVIKLLSNGPKVQGMEKIAGYAINRPEGN